MCESHLPSALPGTHGKRRQLRSRCARRRVAISAGRSAIRIAVTGGAGFIGSHVVDTLIQRGHRVSVIDLAPPGRGFDDWRQVDLMDLDGLVEATAGADAIVHLAAVADVNVARADAVRCVQVNIAGTANVLEAARRNGATRFAFASTVWVYQAAGDGEVDESACFSIDRVEHVYAASKLAGEMLCRSYWQLYGVPFTILRFGIPYGPGMRDELVIARFIKRAMAGQALTIQGTGEQCRAFVYVRDLADGVARSLADAGRNQTYNLDGAEQVSIVQIAKSLDAALGGVRIEFLAARPGDFRGAQVSSEKAWRELGWRPRTSFADGLRQTIDWYSRRDQSVPAAAG